MPERVLVALCILVFWALVPFTVSAEQEISSWSVDVIQSNSGTVIESRSEIYGSRKLRKAKLGMRFKLIEAGNYEIGLIPLLPKNTHAEQVQICLSEIDAERFRPLLVRLSTLVHVETVAERAKLTMLAVPENSTIKFKEKTQARPFIDIRLVYPQPDDPANCQKSWERFLSVAVHEFVHIYTLMTGLDYPNLLSSEVAAHSVTKCVRLAYEEPAAVFPGWEKIEPGSFDFESLYQRTIDGGLMGAGQLGNRDTLVGAAISDIHLIQLLGKEINPDLAVEQEDSILEFCDYVISTPHDFEKSHYFKGRDSN